MTPAELTQEHRTKLTALLTRLIGQDNARMLIEPYERSTGFWFGGGTVTRDADGTILIAGRYRNYGDSRTGLGAGTRGLELAVFASRDCGQSFEKVRSWSKADLSYEGNEVLSIEGVALHFPSKGGCELFVSSEKKRAYPEEVVDFQKPGTGVWTIDKIHGDSLEALDAATIEPVLSESPPPGYLHVKDPKTFERPDGATVLLFCDHPYSWSSMNSGYAVREPEASVFALQAWELVGRGPAWDVAGTRITNRMSVPQAGAFAGLPPLSVYFYDGLECYRSHDENVHAVKRPRGYSCEEIGGALVGFDAEFPAMTRLSTWRPLFVSPHGTGCSRYIDTLVDTEGILATWQQSQDDLSQPLVGNFVGMDEVTAILA